MYVHSYVTATDSHMNADGSSSASTNLIRAGTFHRLQPGTTLHVNNVSVCYLIRKPLAGDFLIQTNRVLISISSIPRL